MAADVGGLIADIGLNVAGLRDDVGKANRELQRGTNKMNRHLGKLRKGVDRVTGGFRGLIAVVGAGALARGIDRTARSLEEVNRQATALGASRETIQELTFTFARFDLQSNDVSDALGTLSDRAQDAKDGMKSFQEDFALVGIEVDDLRNKKPGELFELFAQKVSQVEDPTKRTAAAVRIFGDDLGRKLLPLLLQGQQGLDDYKKAAREAGAVQSDELVKSGAEAAKTFRELRETFSAQFTAAVAQNAEAFKTMAEALADVVKFGGKAIGFFDKAADFLGNAFAGSDNANVQEIEQRILESRQRHARALRLANDRRFRSNEILSARQGSLGPLPSGGGSEGQTLTLLQEIDAKRAEMTSQAGLTRGGNPFEAFGEAAEKANPKMDKARRLLERIDQQAARAKDKALDFGFTFQSAFEDAIIEGRKLSDVFKGLADDIQRIILRQTITQPLGNAVSGMVSGLFSGSTPSGLAGTGGSAGPVAAFAGGGFTGSGPRSGGMDGKGGFPAILHPNETVVDHRKGGGGTTVNIINEGGPEPEVSRRSGPGGDVVDVVIPAITRAIQSGGADGAMRKRFGLNPSPRSR